MGVEILPRTITWMNRADNNEVRPCVRIVDQCVLPEELRYCDLYTHKELIDAIARLAVRGAPALGIAGAYALCLWLCNEVQNKCVDEHFLGEVRVMAQRISNTRPTAINLSWGVAQVLTAVERVIVDVATGKVETTGTMYSSWDYLLKQAVKCARRIEEDDEMINRALAGFGAKLLSHNARVLTHCNAGSLACGFYGTALGVVYSAHAQGKIAHVYVDETRPLTQGARLSMWELMRVGVPCSLQCDSAAAHLMAQGLVDAVIVGADRITRGGDVVNKIGTYALAISADYHNIPLYVAAPTSSLDPTIVDSSHIIIEHRDSREVGLWQQFSPDVLNPAFDITPSHLVRAIITEKGVFAPHQICSALQV